MACDLSLRLLKSGEEVAACEFVRSVFDEFVSSYYTSDGIDEFYKISEPKLLVEENRGDEKIIIVAVFGNEIVGIIKMRDIIHISWLFVAGEHQKKGIAKKLLQYSIDICLGMKPNISHITVNSSPNSVSAYEKLGFIAISPETEFNGMHFTPMRLDSLILIK
jgi:GNAT superfamily N-acetyltransferase